MTGESIEAKNKRIEWIDCTKGIAILLVILGHTIVSHDLIRGLIFAFHMPLFFIFSGMLMHFSDNLHIWRKRQLRGAYHLLLPATVIWALRSIVYIVHNYTMFDIQSLLTYLGNRIIVLFWGSGVPVMLENKNIEALGMMWFLLVLFIAKGIYDFLHIHMRGKGLLAITTISMGVIGVVLGRVQWLPLSFDLALVAILFLFVGESIRYFLKSNSGRISNISLILLNSAVYLLVFSFIYHSTGTYLELAGRRYPLFPLCIISAVAGTMALGGFCFYIEIIPCVGKALCTLGRHSLDLLCIHMMDYVAAPVYSRISSNEFLTALVRIIMDIIVFIVYLRLKKFVKENGYKLRKVENEKL
ncbi:MAG: acyltransferase family protein [Clostridiales bacterium]|nr:acyltransferase family protein [Clostridiales bacterium]